jgi:hypothetical protein
VSAAERTAEEQEEQWEVAYGITPELSLTNTSATPRRPSTAPEFYEMAGLQGSTAVDEV